MLLRCYIYYSGISLSLRQQFAFTANHNTRDTWELRVERAACFCPLFLSFFSWLLDNTSEGAYRRRSMLWFVESFFDFSCRGLLAGPSGHISRVDFLQLPLPSEVICESLLSLHKPNHSATNMLGLPP